MWCAIFFGVLNTIIYGSGMQTDMQVFLMLSFGRTSLLMGDAANFISGYFPIFFFHVFFGTCIYKHFCSGSVYYFSRCKNLTRWFVKECGRLYLYVLGYLSILIASSMLCALAVWHIRLSTDALIGFAYYFAIHSLFLFFTTLAINVVSIFISDSKGFVYIEGALFFCIATFFVAGEKMFPNSVIAPDKMWILEINPISYLVFSVHSSRISALDEAINLYGMNFELNTSVVLFLLLSVITVIIGRFAVEGHNFINTNSENGG